MPRCRYTGSPSRRSSRPISSVWRPRRLTCGAGKLAGELGDELVGDVREPLAEDAGPSELELRKIRAQPKLSPNNRCLYMTKRGNLPQICGKLAPCSGKTVSATSRQSSCGRQIHCQGIQWYLLCRSGSRAGRVERFHPSRRYIGSFVVGCDGTSKCRMDCPSIN